MKVIITCAALLSVMSLGVIAEDDDKAKEKAAKKALKEAKKKIPRGAFLLSELEEAKAEAAKKKKPICFVQT